MNQFLTDYLFMFSSLSTICGQSSKSGLIGEMSKFCNGVPVEDKGVCNSGGVTDPTFGRN